MKNNYTLIFLAFLLAFSFSSVLAQSSSVDVDSKAPFIVNPNPHELIVDNPLEETFGLNQYQYGPATLRARGNIYYCNNPRKLVEHKFYLATSAPPQLWFCVYEGATFEGNYNLVNSVFQTGSSGQGWYSSGTIDYDFHNGMYYAIYLQWDTEALYWMQENITPHPIPCSFGELQAGIGWGWNPPYGDPPPTTQYITEMSGIPIAYYQKIVTDDILPVELMSFTYLLDGNDVTFNWITATETNNQRFELQRKTNGDYNTITNVNGCGTTTETHSYSLVDRDLQPGNYTYRLKQIDFDGSEYYYDELFVAVQPPTEFSIAQNYPNPFNPNTTIDFSLAVDSKVTLKVYNVLGQEVMSLVNSDLVAGAHTTNVNASELNSGIYFYTIEATGSNGTNFVAVKKMILMK